MRKLLLVLLMAVPAIAEKAPVREVFPNDYTPQPCAADTASVCQSWPKDRMSEYASAFRSYNLPREWVDKHWAELTPLFTPVCAKIANCFTVKDNGWVYCVDLLRDELLATCDRFPAGSQDSEHCRMFAFTYYLGLGAKTEQHAQSQECAEESAGGERKLQWWMTQERFDLDFDGKFTLHAHDAETHIPVRAKVAIDAGTLVGTGGPVATAGLPSKYRAGLRRVPNAEGHRDVVAPTVTLSATGYQTITFPLPIEVPKVIAEMSPDVSSLKPGKNTITITARDAATNEPVEMRVMAGDRVLGNTNLPLQLELQRGQKRPEIWMTSLFDRYSDVVIAKAE